MPRTLGSLRGSMQRPIYQMEVQAYENTYLLSFYLQEVNEPIGSKWNDYFKKISYEIIKTWKNFRHVFLGKIRKKGRFLKIFFERPPFFFFQIFQNFWSIVVWDTFFFKTQLEFFVSDLPFQRLTSIARYSRKISISTRYRIPIRYAKLIPIR